LVRRLAILGVVIAAVVVAIVLIAAGGKDHKVPAGAVADVNGQTVSKPQFDHWLNVVSAVQAPPKAKTKPKPPQPGSAQYKQLTQQVMQFLVSAKWIEGEAADRGLTASPQEINSQFTQTKKQSFPNDKAYQKFLKTSGQSQADIIYRVKLDVLSNKLRQDVTKDVGTVSDGDIKSYYDQNQQQFSQPERRDLREVLTKTQPKAQEAIKRLQGGESFDKVAKALSVDPATKGQGGRLLGVAKGQQDKSFDAAIFSAVKGQLAGPVKSSQGYYVFRVDKVTPATKQSLDQSKVGIRQLLLSQKQQKVLDSFTTDFRSKWRGKTDCLKAYVIPDCSNGKEPPVPGLGTGPPAKAGTGQPPALGGAAQTPAPSSFSPSGAVPGAAPSTAGAAATAPPALNGSGSPAALGGTPTPAALPQGVPGGATQGTPQQGTPQQGTPQGGSTPGG
jgi:foldase protein PrsA